ncbi:MAG: hypothetical protein AAGK17_13100 [Pseudomonadota bacterium]
MTGDQVFNTACASVANPQGNPSITLFPDNFTLAFEEASETFTAAGSSPFGDIDASFGPADIVAEEAGVFTLYFRDSGQTVNGNPFNNVFAFGTPQFNGGSAEYVRLAELITIPAGQTVPSSFQCALGIPTELDDPLPQTVLNFGASLGANGTATRLAGTDFTIFSAADSVLSLTADPTNGSIDFTIDVRGRESTPNPAGGLPILSDTVEDLASFSGSTSIDGSVQSFSGLTANDQGLFAGEFSGWFFGPQGAEIGIAINGQVQLPDASTVSFLVVFGGPQDTP